MHDHCYWTKGNSGWLYNVHGYHDFIAPEGSVEVGSGSRSTIEVPEVETAELTDPRLRGTLGDNPSVTISLNFSIL